ncbi:SGNH family lipase [Kitasatospora kazusensis]|uniref:SGNH family lipase n=1 Tax=Kitasatospora kazusensis TaxID=407974 RepID=A0ABN3A4S8_9ACTN
MRHQLLAAAAALTVTLSAAPAAATPPPTQYAALGDSYAAGVGAGSYDQASGDCHRSSRSYAALWAAEHHPAAFLAAACSGAALQDVVADQLPRVGADTTLVTLTAGGNDLAFADAVGACLQPFTTDARCDAALDESDRLLREELPGRLDTTYRAVRTAAPNARVVVTGYPHLLETGGLCAVGTEPRRVRFDALTDRLDELIAAQADKQGFRFADPRGPFGGHGVCARDGREWINRIVLTSLWESFHPTADGQSLGYLPVVAAAAEQ